MQAGQAKQAEQSQAAAGSAKDAAEKFAAASGLAAVFGALNLNEDVRVQCLARTVQWFQELGVRLVARAVAPHADERMRAAAPNPQYPPYHIVLTVPQSTHSTTEHPQYPQYHEYSHYHRAPTTSSTQSTTEYPHYPTVPQSTLLSSRAYSPVPMHTLIACGLGYSSRTVGWLGDGKLAGKHQYMSGARPSAFGLARLGRAAARTCA